MNFEFLNNTTLRAYGIAPALQEVIVSIPNVAGGRDGEAARRRIFSSPGDESSLREDWSALVEPELTHLFQTAEQTVAMDLETLKDAGDDEGLELMIPMAHVDAWLNCLNQARLVLAEQIDYTENDHMREFTGPPQNPREFAIFQIELYALMQEWLIHVSEYGDDEFESDATDDDADDNGDDPFNL
jgi:hypothetical protein